MGTLQSSSVNRTTCILKHAEVASPCSRQNNGTCNLEETPRNNFGVPPYSVRSVTCYIFTLKMKRTEELIRNPKCTDSISRGKRKLQDIHCLTG